MTLWTVSIVFSNVQHRFHGCISIYIFKII